MSTSTATAKNNGSGRLGPKLQLDTERFRDAFNREPIGFSHNLSELDLFKMDSLHRLAEKMDSHPKDYFIAQGAKTAGTGFFTVPYVPLNASQAIEVLDNGSHRILLKRAENHDPHFRELIDTLFQQVVKMIRGLSHEKITRLESGILISSAATITPFHFDPEIGMFSQIEGEKIYHVYSPTVVQEDELERCSVAGPGNLAPLALEGRDPAKEYVYHLDAGRGFHQPHCAPHWVETGKTRSISYTFVFETESTRAMGRTRAFNHYVRKLNLGPSAPGSNPGLDSVKATTMQAVFPVRRQAALLANKIRSR
jgi:hypothetical protein